MTPHEPNFDEMPYPMVWAYFLWHLALGALCAAPILGLVVLVAMALAVVS